GYRVIDGRQLLDQMLAHADKHRTGKQLAAHRASCDLNAHHATCDAAILICEHPTRCSSPDAKSLAAAPIGAAEQDRFLRRNRGVMEVARLRNARRGICRRVIFVRSPRPLSRPMSATIRWPASICRTS